MPFATSYTVVPVDGKVAKKVAETGLPLGITTGKQFERLTLFATYGLRYSISKKFGIGIALEGRIGLRGSSITGRGYVVGQGVQGPPFRPTSDLDLFIVNRSLFERWKKIALEEGMKYNSKKNNSGTLSDPHLKKLGLLRTVQTLRAITGNHKLTVKLYSSNTGILSGGPSLQRRIYEGKTKETFQLPRSTIFVWDNRRLARKILTSPRLLYFLVEFMDFMRR